MTITAASPMSAISKPLRQALVPLIASLAVLGLVLILASLLQVRLGLRPLERLRHDIGKIRAGQLRQIPGGQPSELLPLVAELNGLIDQNEAGLISARRHAANLAHSLKTPLATLSLELAEPGRDPGQMLKPLVAKLERSIRHHLGRARAATPGHADRSHTLIASRLEDLVMVLKRIHVDKPVTVLLDVPPDLAVACEPQDLDEMLGNLLDNGFKWARSQLVVRAERAGSQIEVAIEDDGPGLPEGRLEEALVPGMRLDETVPGDGFGLAITRELAELHGGALGLRRGKTGGLCATLTLPAGGG